MIHISRGIGSPKAKTYWSNDFSNVASVSYYTEQQQRGGEWHGQFAAAIGLTGPVDEKQFMRLAEGCSPTALHQAEQLKPWRVEAGAYTLRDNSDVELARVWRDGQTWRRS